MKKINILESLLNIDKKTSNRYELATLYEACRLKEDEKLELVKYIDSYKDPSLIGQYLSSKCDGLCEYICDDDCSDLEVEIKNEVEKDDIVESLELDDAKQVRKYLWSQIKDVESLNDDDSLYWEFEDGINQGDGAKLVTDEIDVPNTASYKFSIIELGVNLYYDYDELCWYVLDKNYVSPSIDESVNISTCPVCDRKFAEHEFVDNQCPRCKETLQITDSGEYVLADRDLEEDLAHDLERRYTVPVESVQSYIDELSSHESVDNIETVVLHEKELFKLTGVNGKVLYLLPVTMSQVDVYDESEKLLDKSEFIKYIPNEFLKDSETEFTYLVVGGDCAGTYTKDELEALPCFSGKYSDDLSDIRNSGGFVHRSELDNQPELDGYVGPMMDGWKGDKMVIRYETQDVYNMLSEKLFEMPNDWTDYCPHCTNRSLFKVDDDKAICDECGAEYEYIPSYDGKVKLIELDALTEGILSDLKKVGSTVKDIAKERWNDSYTKAIATGVKKNLANTKLGKDIKRVGDSIKDTDTYKKVAKGVKDVKNIVKNNIHDDNRTPDGLVMSVRGKDYNVSDLKFIKDGKKMSPEEVAKLSAFERRKIKVQVPRGVKPVKEGYFSDDDVEDDIMHANVYGGDTTYCRECGMKLHYDEDGFTYCPECNSED